YPMDHGASIPRRLRVEKRARLGIRAQLLCLARRERCRALPLECVHTSSLGSARLKRAPPRGCHPPLLFEHSNARDAARAPAAGGPARCEANRICVVAEAV